MINKRYKQECRHGINNLRMYNGGVICMRCRTPFKVLNLDTEINAENNNIKDAIETIKLYNNNLTILEVLELYKASIDELQNELFVAVLMEEERDSENHKVNLEKKPEKIRPEKAYLVARTKEEYISLKLSGANVRLKVPEKGYEDNIPYFEIKFNR